MINARRMRVVPGRKIDVGDAQWGARLIEHGLVRPSSFRPRPPVSRQGLDEVSEVGDRGTRPRGVAAPKGHRGRRRKTVIDRFIGPHEIRPGHELTVSSPGSVTVACLRRWPEAGCAPD